MGGKRIDQLREACTPEADKLRTGDARAAFAGEHADFLAAGAFGLHRRGVAGERLRIGCREQAGAVEEMQVGDLVPRRPAVEPGRLGPLPRRQGFGQVRQRGVLGQQVCADFLRAFTDPFPDAAVQAAAPAAVTSTILPLAWRWATTFSASAARSSG